MYLVNITRMLGLSRRSSSGRLRCWHRPRHQRASRRHSLRDVDTIRVLNSSSRRCGGSSSSSSSSGNRSIPRLGIATTGGETAPRWNLHYDCRRGGRGGRRAAGTAQGRSADDPQFFSCSSGHFRIVRLAAASCKFKETPVVLQHDKLNKARRNHGKTRTKPNEGHQIVAQRHKTNGGQSTSKQYAANW